MSRRVRLPGADELFRVTSPDQSPPDQSSSGQSSPDQSSPDQSSSGQSSPDQSPPDQSPPDQSASGAARAPQPSQHGAGAAEEAREPGPGHKSGSRRGSGRIKHDEKMTVYLTAEELLEVEHARLSLRRQLGNRVDRGRLVREALALALADYEARGADSDIARRLRRT